MALDHLKLAVVGLLMAGCGDSATSAGPGGTSSGGSSVGGSGGTGGDTSGGAGGDGGDCPFDPPIEVCDDIDNDCDGEVDEDFVLGCDDPLSDTDGDGLRDWWEVYGIDGVDLPAMGASPLRKDAFVHEDWMEDVDHSDRFSDEAMWRVQQAFLDAPLINPDGSTGVSLHIDAGPDSIMNPLTMETWGALSLAGPIPHQDEVSYNFVDGGDVVGLRDLHLPPERATVFRYGVAIHALGLSAPFGNCPDKFFQFNGFAWDNVFSHSQSSTDPLLVALGGFDPNVMDVVQESAHYMHELGHTFGLPHGGTNTSNRKPNYFSVMNYNYSYRGLYRDGSYGTLDYSRFTLPELSEFELDESFGLGAPNELAGYGFIRFCGEYDITCLDDLTSWPGELVHEPDATLPVDWNCNGMIDPGTISAEVNATIDLNFVHTTQNDWDNLDFTAYGLLGGGPQTGNMAMLVDDLMHEPRRDDPLPIDYRVVAAGQGRVHLEAGQAVMKFVVINRGTKRDTYRPRWSGRGISAPPDLAPIELKAGEHRVIEVAVDVPQHPAGSRSALRLHVSSARSPRMAAEATTVVIH